MLEQRVYIGFFWLDGADIPTHRIASLSKEDVISAAKKYLVQLNIRDSSWETFLLTELGDWDGLAIVSNTVDTGKIFLMSAPLGAGGFQ